MQGIDFVQRDVRVTAHRDHDDLLSGGLGLAGLKVPPTPFADPQHPTCRSCGAGRSRPAGKGSPISVRWVVTAPSMAVSRRAGSRISGVRVFPAHMRRIACLLQVPIISIGPRCLVVTASSGSRGIYGAIALAGAWGLPRGCAVAYTDKGTGSGYFDYADDSGVALGRSRAKRGTADAGVCAAASASQRRHCVKHDELGRQPGGGLGTACDAGGAVRSGHAGSRFSRRQAPFTPQNTKIIATGLSNGGGAVLQAAGLDEAHVCRCGCIGAERVH
jgi:hydroxybutyrate-dimer hydrolase